MQWERDLPRPEFADLRNISDGDPCAMCDDGTLHLGRGIEVGHVFKLGDKYTRSMKMTVLNHDGREQTPLMGCYGIGVSRIVAAAIEQNHDDKGVVWPISIAPFHVELILINPKEEAAAQLAEELYDRLRAEGIEAILDDRNERLGVKFKDADLIGAPVRAVIGGRGVKEGVVEVQDRKDGSSEKIAISDVGDFLVERVRSLLAKN